MSKYKPLCTYHRFMNRWICEGVDIVQQPLVRYCSGGTMDAAYQKWAASSGILTQDKARIDSAWETELLRRLDWEFVLSERKYWRQKIACDLMAEEHAARPRILAPPSPPKPKYALTRPPTPRKVPSKKSRERWQASCGEGFEWDDHRVWLPDPFEDGVRCHDELLH